MEIVGLGTGLGCSLCRDQREGSASCCYSWAAGSTLASGKDKGNQIASPIIVTTLVDHSFCTELSGVQRPLSDPFQFTPAFFSCCGYDTELVGLHLD